MTKTERTKFEQADRLMLLGIPVHVRVLDCREFHPFDGVITDIRQKRARVQACGSRAFTYWVSWQDISIRPPENFA